MHKRHVMSLRARAPIRVLHRPTLSTHTTRAQGIKLRQLPLLLTFSNKRCKLTFSRQSYSTYCLWTTGTTPHNSETDYFTVPFPVKKILHLTVILHNSSDDCRQNYSSSYQLLVYTSHLLGTLDSIKLQGI